MGKWQKRRGNGNSTSRLPSALHAELKAGAYTGGAPLPQSGKSAEPTMSRKDRRWHERQQKRQRKQAHFAPPAPKPPAPKPAAPKPAASKPPAPKPSKAPKAPKPSDRPQSAFRQMLVERGLVAGEDMESETGASPAGEWAPCFARFGGVGLRCGAVRWWDGDGGFGIGGGHEKWR